MKRSKPSRWSPPPQPGEETFQVIIVNTSQEDYLIPGPTTRTVVKPVPMGTWLGVKELPRRKKKAKPQTKEASAE
jgi:hypothetical protein